MREASKKLGNEKLQKMFASMPHKHLDLKLAEVAIYDRGSDFLLAWTGDLQSKREMRRMFHLPELSVEDHILAGWCGRIAEVQKMIKMK